jgi:hypothetical protein
VIDALFIPDWDALDANARQTYLGRVTIGDWPHTFHVRNDNDRLFLDLLADSPTSEWLWFYDTQSGDAPTPDAFRARVTAIHLSRLTPAVTSLESIDWPGLQVRVRAAADLIVRPAYLHHLTPDAFLLYASIFSSDQPRRPHHLSLALRALGLA